MISEAFYSLYNRAKRILNLFGEILYLFTPIPWMIRGIRSLLMSSAKCLDEPNAKSINPPVSLEPKPPSRTVMTQLIRPFHTDGRNVAYGGQILAWIDICAGVTAKKHALGPCVTASVDAVHFFAPVKLGEMCILKATINRAWNTSMEVGVKVEAENLITGERRFCCHAYLTFVSVENGKPQQVPSVLASTPNEKRRYWEADQRRTQRFQRKSQKQQIGPIPIKPFSEETSLITPVLDSPPRKVSVALEKTCSRTYTEVVEIVFPQHANSLSITFGGQIMMWMEYCAAMAASRHCRTPLLTASIDSLTFLKPTRVGNIVTVRGIVVASFSHSVEVYVTVETEDTHGQTHITNDGWMTLVAKDSETGVFTKIEPVIALSESERVLQEHCQERRQRRLQERDTVKEMIHHVDNHLIDDEF